MSWRSETKTPHVFASEEVAARHPPSYFRDTDFGVPEGRCLLCGEWVPPSLAEDPCPNGVYLVVGLMYRVRVGGDPEEVNALLVNEPVDRQLGCWFVYDWPPGSGETKLTAARGIEVYGLDNAHAFGLWDAIADCVVLPTPEPGQVPALRTVAGVPDDALTDAPPEIAPPMLLEDEP